MKFWKPSCSLIGKNVIINLYLEWCLKTWEAFYVTFRFLCSNESWDKLHYNNIAPKIPKGNYHAEKVPIEGWNNTFSPWTYFSIATSISKKSWTFKFQHKLKCTALLHFYVLIWCWTWLLVKLQTMRIPVGVFETTRSI